MGSQFCEYILQIIINPEIFGFGGLHQTVHDGTRLGTTDGIYIDPVLTADSEGADGTFCRVVVHGNITVIQKDTEMRFLIQTVLQGFVGVATGWNGLHGLGQSRSEAGGVPHRGCSGGSLRRASSSWTWCWSQELPHCPYNSGTAVPEEDDCCISH